jgi:hypothetical protein
VLQDLYIFSSSFFCLSNRPKDRYGNNLATSTTSVDISLCSQNCKSGPGFAALWMTAYCPSTQSFFAIKNKYGGGAVQLAQGQSQPIIVEISPLSDGSFQGRILFSDPETYVINLMLNQTSISGSPFEVMVFPVSEDPQSSLCTMEFTKFVANSTFLAGSMISVSLFARNKYGVFLDSADPSKFNMQVQGFPSISILAGNDPKGVSSEQSFDFVAEVTDHLHQELS